MNVYAVYPDLESYPWSWLEPVREQKVRRYRHPSGDLIDVYSASGDIWGVIPNIAKENVPDFQAR